MQDRTGRDTGEDSLLIEQLARALEGVAWAHGEAGGQDAGVVELGHEAFIKVAESVDEFAVARLRGDDLDVGLLLTQVAPRAHEGAGRAQARDEVRDRGQVAQDFRARGRVVRLGIGRIAVLIEHHPVGMLRSHTPCDADGFVGTAGARGVHDLGTPHTQDLRAFHRGVLRHDADELVSLEPRGHGE